MTQRLNPETRRLGPTHALLAGLIGFGCLCSGGDEKVTHWKVLAHREDGAASSEMRPIRERDGERLQVPPTLFRNFEPRWGYEYDLTVRTTPYCVKVDAAQGVRTTLDDVQENPVKPGTKFRIRNIQTKFLAPDRRSFVDGQPFACAAPACASLDGRTKTDSFDLIMQHGAEPGEIELLEVADPTCRERANNQDCHFARCESGRCVPF